MRALLLGFGFACAACISHEEVVTLADFEDAKLTLSISNDGTDVAVLLRNRPRAGGTPCTVIEDQVAATLDGVPMDVTSRGAYVPPPATDAASNCTPPTFHLITTVSAAPSALAISDGITTISAAVASLRVPRQFTLVGELHPGADARLEWSVPSDTVADQGLETRLPGVSWSPDAGTGFLLGAAYAAPGVRIDGTALVVSIPATALPGTGAFRFSDLFGATFVSCDVAICEAPPIAPPLLRATIAP